MAPDDRPPYAPSEPAPLPTFPNPWKCHSSRVVYENPWITVREDQVTRPDGQPGIYGVVQPRIATGVVAFTPDRQVYLVGQYRYTISRYSWEIIEGGSESHESALQAVQRELEEEAGLRAASWEQLGGEIHLSNCFSSEVAVLFIAWDLTPVTARPEGTEELEIRTVPFATCLELARRGEITDAMTLLAFDRAKAWFALRDRNER